MRVLNLWVKLDLCSFRSLYFLLPLHSLLLSLLFLKFFYFLVCRKDSLSLIFISESSRLWLLFLMHVLFLLLSLLGSSIYLNDLNMMRILCWLNLSAGFSWLWNYVFLFLLGQLLLFFLLSMRVWLFILYVSIWWLLLLFLV